MATIAGIAAGSRDFDVLVTALGAAGLVGAVADPAADLTVFAPTDAAFERLARALGFEGHADDAGVFAFIAQALAGLAPDDNPIPLLTEILLYHVSPGERTLSELNDLIRVPTLAEATLAVDGRTVRDLDPDLPEPRVAAANVQADNGVIQVLDRVLLPFDLPASDGANDVDVAIGSARGDTFATGADRDVLVGKAGADTLDGGAGADVISGGTGRDALIGRSGADRLDGGAQADRAFGGDGHDVLLGGLGDDGLHGGSGADRLSGGRGADRLGGGVGGDRLDGGLGADVLAGGGGHDLLIGGAGADRFVFAAGAGRDLVTDFEDGIDRLDFRSFPAVQGLDDLSVDQVGADVVISFHGGSITLDAITVADLGRNDFLFS